MPELDIKKTSNWISSAISIEKNVTGEINFIFCSDEYLLDINKKYLNHNYFTDVITFDYCEGNIVSGDIFISFDRVVENAISLKVNTEIELRRVIIHGVLHLLGFKDKTDDEKLTMREKEDFYLNLF